MVSPIEFSPNPASVVSGVCVSSAQIVDISGQSVTLISLQAEFTDQSGTKADFTLNANELKAILDSPVIIANGTANGSFSFDLGSKGLTSTADGSIVIVGAGGADAIQYVGALRCEVP